MNRTETGRHCFDHHIEGKKNPYERYVVNRYTALISMFVLFHFLTFIFLLGGFLNPADGSTSQTVL